MVDVRTKRISSILAALAVAVVVGVVACPGNRKSERRTPTLATLTVTPVNPTIALGTSVQFVATGTYSDGTTLDLTDLVDWGSSAPAGSVSMADGTRGLASGLEVGSTTVTAALSGQSASTTLTVSAAVLSAIDVTPPDPQIALGTSQQFAATGIFTDGTAQDLTGQVSWQSSATDASTISNDPGSRGLALSAGLGDTTISATLDDVSGSTVLTVSSAALVAIEVTPPDARIALGTSLQFTAVGIFTDDTVQDLTSEVDWTSSAPAADVSNAAGERGRADSFGVGSTTISAAHSGVSGSTTLTVTDAALVSIAVTPFSPQIALGTSLELTATGTFTDGSVQDLSSQVTWTSTDASVAAVANAAGSEGRVGSLAVGTATISAEHAGIRGSTDLVVSSAVLVSVEVTPTQPSVALGTTLALAATGVFSDGTAQDVTGEATWSSSDPAVATVSNAWDGRGLATTSGTGNTTITATLAGASGWTTLTVSDAALIAIAVSPDGSTLAKGTSLALSARGLLTDGTRQDLTEQVTWSSSDDSIATVSNAAGSRGLARGAGVGSVDVSASLLGVAGSVHLEVSAATLDSIDVSPYQQSIAKGTRVQFAAMGNYSDWTTQELTAQVTWSSSDAGVAAISNAAGSQGLATGLGVGTATISAALAGVVESMDLDVTAAVLDSIVLTPESPNAFVGKTCTFRATGAFSDGGAADLTQLVTWSSSDTDVATISNAAGSEGLAWAVASGTSVITATYLGESVTTVLTVTEATLAAISVGPADPFVPAGFWVSLRALGTYDDGSTADVTAEVLWSSSNTSVAAVSNSAGSEGRMVGMAAGTATITASLPSTPGAAPSAGPATAFVTVTSEQLTSIEVEPASVSLALGETRQMTARGHFFSGTVLDLTNQVRWTVTPRNVATIDNSTDDGTGKGALTTLRKGNTTIRASKGNVTGTAPLSVH